MLTGLYEPTKGTAFIAGYDIITNITEIHRHLGVCPQFDIQHADLTAEEHLLFYARLKGVKWSREKAVVEKALKHVSKLSVLRTVSQLSTCTCTSYLFSVIAHKYCLSMVR